MIRAILNPQNWAGVPFHFWSLVLFVFGTMVGSFLNVCIHRLPLGQSVVSPPSHCPHCRYSIPWYLNIPLVTWLYLRGKCRNCGAPISIRYFLVELLTGLLFLGSWLMFGQQSPALSLTMDLLVAGLLAATFIDFEHFIIPDEITIGGMAAGFICSMFVPAMHEGTMKESMVRSLLGMAFGAGLIYAILRLGKLLFGRQKVSLPTGARIVFTETAVVLPDKEILYEDLFYRPSDVVALRASTLELVDRCYKNARVRLSPASLEIDEEKVNPEDVPHMEAVAEEIVLPREAMGFGDVKFMGAIGAFLGWQSVVFALMVSSIVGALVGISLILMGKRAWSSRLPYGPYIALAAAIWVFGGKDFVEWWFVTRFQPPH
ncbi:MAG TPA: prepilin peptidase [Candidatus Dormibacteraeota bacterium]|nr:prepilin peptidase [Candidatus Dormibacteraeota bacterium]